ncbi:MAG: DUF4440 domain-containing protein [Bacteroidetes bacterium]|nr:MAG: DUF4440 domain-containing protein [Bacteroidota bacterium]
MKIQSLSIAFLLLLNTSIVLAQVSTDSELFITLKSQDSLFFERGFNQCDLVFLESHLTEDLKFYHDQSGFQDREAFFENTRKYICSGSGAKPIRTVDPTSLAVFPLYDDGEIYGAIQTGVHHFYLREQGVEDVWTSTAKFTHVWVLDNEVWKLSEVLSYDHQPPTNELSLNTIEQLLVESNVPALGLGIIENGHLTKVEVYGTLDGKRTAPYNTVFKVASLTKPIVALLTLKLIDEGLLELEEPLYKYWVDPDLVDDPRHKLLTPEIILSHQTGFPNWRYMTETNVLAFQFDPGTRYQYSGEGFEYLRKAIENKLGKSMEELAEEKLFGPLGMNDTRFWWDAGMDESRYAYNFNENGEMIEVDKYYEANAAANLLTTVEDYGKFAAYVVNGADLSDTLFQNMLAHHVQLRENDFFGLGWEILTGFPNDEYALLHTGKDPGVSTLVIVFPHSKNGYIIFLNGDHTDPVYEEILTHQLYFGEALWNKR